MIFSSKARPFQRGAVASLAAGAVMALVAACGGSTSQVEAFQPERLFAFGDETSLLLPDGRRYGVNGFNTETKEPDCRQEPIWVQSVANTYGFVFAECNPTGVAEPQARMRAALGAKVADVAAQVEAQVAAGGFRSSDLALLLAGMNDVLELYRQFPARSEASLLDEAGQRGRAMAAVVNRLVALGAKVVVSNLPDLGVSPYALAEKAAHADTDRAALISRISAAFNDQLGVNVLLDGRFVGLMQSDIRTQGAARSPFGFGLVDASRAVCTVALPDCTTATLLADAIPAQYLWADDTRLAPGGQNLLAELAILRARRNPF